MQSKQQRANVHSRKSPIPAPRPMRLAYSLAVFIATVAPARSALAQPVAPAALVGTGCGEQYGARDVVSVEVELRNTGNENWSGRHVRVTLQQSGSGELASMLTVDVPPRSSKAVPFFFSFDQVSTGASVTIELEGAGQVIKDAPVTFACVPSCPPYNVVTVEDRPCADSAGEDAPLAECPNHDGSMGNWIGQVAAATRCQTYCSYAWDSEQTDPDLTPFERLDSDRYQYEVDCGVVAGTGTKNEAAPPFSAASKVLPGTVELASLIASTDTRIGIDDLQLFLEAGLTVSTSPVTIAVMDSSAVPFDAARPRDNSEHGRSVGLLAHRTACADTKDCPVEIDNRLVMPIVEVEKLPTGWAYATDAVRGGFFGTRGVLASELHSLLEDWDGQPAPEPLIINLSLGWHSKHDCNPVGCGFPLQVDLASTISVPDGTGTGIAPEPSETEAFSLATKAVLIEVARARCLGAAVIAGAGNSAPGDDFGPLLPGAWNAVNAARLNCANVFSGRASQGQPRGPLVTAVGAINAHGHPIALTREGSLPPWVAQGSGIALDDTREPDGVIGGGGGTSFAAAVVSGALARLLAYTGSSLSVEDALQRLHDVGAELESPLDGANVNPADLCVHAGRRDCPVPREITACSALLAFANWQEQQTPQPDYLSELIEAASNCVPERMAPGILGTIVEPLECSLLPDSTPAEQKWLQAHDVAEDEIAEVQEAELDNLLCDVISAVERPDSRPKIDEYEAAWAVRGQPWGPKCVTCKEYRIEDEWTWETNFAVVFSIATTTSPIQGAFITVSGDSISLASSYINAAGTTVSGTRQFSVYSPSSSPGALGVTYAPSNGVPATASTELTQLNGWFL